MLLLDAAACLALQVVPPKPTGPPLVNGYEATRGEQLLLVAYGLEEVGGGGCRVCVGLGTQATWCWRGHWFWHAAGCCGMQGPQTERQTDRQRDCLASQFWQPDISYDELPATWCMSAASK
jgi:hypothetical protein